VQHKAIGFTAILSLVVSVAVGCGHAGPPPAEAANGTHIDLNTPQGIRAKQTVDMINSDWPIGTVGVRTLAVPEQVDDITAAMGRLWSDRPITVTGIDMGAGEATLHLRTPYGADEDVELRTNDVGLVDRFEVTVLPPPIHDWADIDAQLQRSGAKYSYQVSKVTGGACTHFAGTNDDASLPLASIFKLYVLLALGEAVSAGTVRWDDQLTITKQVMDVGSAGFDKLPPGTKVSVRTVAQQMISASDNMATDMLINRIGHEAVERAMVAAGHHDPALMTPFPTTHELFTIGWGKPDLREQWQHASPAVRAHMLQETDTRAYEPDAARVYTPASPFGVEWFGTANDICRVHAALQAAAVGKAAPVKDILSAVPGIDLDRGMWPYIAAKAGNLPGDLTFSWYAVDRTGQPWVVSFQLTWPKYRSLAAAQWVLAMAKQAFGMLPVS
jgi:beta-lactamase class A